MKTRLKRLLVLVAFVVGGNIGAPDHLGASTTGNGQSLLSTANSSKEIADDFYEKKDYKKAREHYRAALKEAEGQEDHTTVGKCLIRLGRCHQRLNEYSEALSYYFRFNDLSGDYTMAEDRANVCRYMASIYQKLGDYEKSYDLHLESLRLNEEIGDSTRIAKNYYDLGYLFYFQDQFSRSKGYFEKAYGIYAREQNEKKIFSCLAAIGCIYGSTDSLTLALDYQFKALALAEKLDLQSGAATTLHNIGVYYSLSKQYALGYEYLQQGLERRIALNDVWGQMGSYKYLGDHFIRTNNPAEAVKYLKKGLEISEQMATKTRDAELYKSIAEAYTAMDDYKQSNIYLQRYASLKDTIMGDRIATELGAVKTKYEIQKKQMEIARLKEKNTWLEQTKLLRYKFIGFFLVALLLSIVVVFLTYFIHSQKQHNAALHNKNKQIYHQNEELAYANRKMELTNQKLELANQQLAYSNRELKRFAYIASHDLKAPLRTIGSFTGLLKRRYSHLFDQVADEYMGFIIDGAKQMHQLLDDLLAYSQIENNQKVEQVLDTREIVHTALSNLQCNIAEKGAKIEVEEGSLPCIKGNPSLMTQLFQNIISNGIKFTENSAPHIQIGCKANGKKYTFSIADNGIGIDEAFREKIFDMFSRLHVAGVYEGTGIGLATCKKIINGYGGDIWVESRIGQGSTFYFTLPKSN